MSVLGHMRWKCSLKLRFNALAGRHVGIWRDEINYHFGYMPFLSEGCLYCYCFQNGCVCIWCRDRALNIDVKIIYFIRKTRLYMYIQVARPVVKDAKTFVFLQCYGTELKTKKAHRRQSSRVFHIFVMKLHSLIYSSE